MNTLTVISKKYGIERINLDSFDPERASVSSTIFKISEHIFNDWFEHNTQPGAPLSKDIKFVYYGGADEPAVFQLNNEIGHMF